MRPIDEIRTVINTATDVILKEQRKDSKGRISVIDQAYLILLAKAQAFDDISEIFEREESNWWN